MVDLKLKRVTIRNWMKIRSTCLEFPESGLVLVQGINKASGGALLSVGSGKTGVGEAISRTLLGVQGRFATLRQFSLDKGGDLYVKVEAELHGKPLVVESGYRCQELNPDNEALVYHYDGVTVQRGQNQQTREQLSKLLGVTPLLASWTVFIDGDNIKFNKLSQSDSVDLVMASLRQPPWSDYHEKAKKKAGQFRRAMAQTEASHNSATETVAEVKDRVRTAKETLSTVKADYDEAVKEHKAAMAEQKQLVGAKTKLIDGAKTEQEKIEKQLKLMEDQRAVANHELEIKLHDIEDQLLEAQNARTPLSAAREAATTKSIEAKSAYDNYANAAKECPTCKRPMGTLDQKHLASLKALWDTAKTKASAASTAWTKAEQKVVTLNESYRSVSRQQREVSAKQDVEHLSDRHAELSQGITDALEEIHAIELQIAKGTAGPSDSSVKSAETRLMDAKTALQSATAKLDEIAAELEGDRSTCKVLDYWVMAYSPYGIPNLVLRDAIAPLNKEARRVSATMTGGTIEVRYSTIKELASGLEKAKLNIEVDNKLGDKDLGGSSKGEAGLTNFIIAETLSEVGQVSRRVGYRWYDEIVPHQDPKVCHNIYAYMKEIAQQAGVLIFLVEHDPVAANYADYIMVVEKNDDHGVITTSVRWAN
jgi:DNA repair exonuclease SbcCD ATPase subunit